MTMKSGGKTRSSNFLVACASATRTASSTLFALVRAELTRWEERFERWSRECPLPTYCLSSLARSRWSGAAVGRDAGLRFQWWNDSASRQSCRIGLTGRSLRYYRPRERRADSGRDLSCDAALERNRA